ncbi:hypothetical protein SAMN02910289_01723 [Lachnospiraceae bacterium RM5]|nr:hypothetical protein SAMN02910289_01723 [Lachnospiraceae bacterium RM5]
MGHGYKGDTGHHHSIRENLSSLISSYDYYNGYFGEKGQGRNFVRNITSADPVKTAQDFYDKAAYGGIERPMANGKGHYTKMKDGAILSYREVSSSDGTPVVEINIKKSTDHGGIKYQKIHFVKGR